jgi:hypothetical protein
VLVKSFNLSGELGPAQPWGHVGVHDTDQTARRFDFDDDGQASYPLQELQAFRRREGQPPAKSVVQEGCHRERVDDEVALGVKGVECHLLVVSSDGKHPGCVKQSNAGRRILSAVNEVSADEQAVALWVEIHCFQGCGEQVDDAM